MEDVFIQALQAAASQNIEQVKRAEDQLKEWETTKGFYPKLLEIFMATNLEVNIRWIAIIYLKNGISRYWRRVAKNGMSEEEKAFIREKITIFNETLPELALQVAVTIGRIARSDIKFWPEVLQRTLQAIKMEDALHQHRGLLTLNQIAKELASKRLVSDRRVFQEISTNIFTFLEELCYHHLSKVSSSTAEVTSSLDMCILITKVLRRLLNYGAAHYPEESNQMRFVKWCIQHVRVFDEQRKSPEHTPNKRERFDKFMVLLMKVLSDFEEHQSSSLAPVLLDVVQLCLQHILSNTNSSDTTTPPTLTIYCGNLLRSLARRFTKQKTPSPSSEILLNVLNAECLKTLSYHVVMNYFPLTRDEMDEWTNDPEGYINVEAGESHKFLLRPCMETFYVGLFYGFKDTMIPCVVDLVREANQFNMETASPSDILKLCAIFKAVGLASYELFEEIDFDAWFADSLLHVFNLPGEKFSVVQHHVMWMIGEWINVKLSKHNRVRLYKLIASILTSDRADLVLKLTACKTLRTAVDDFDFVLDDFAPHVNDIFPVMCRLLVHVDECDSKMLVLNILSVTIERVGDQVHQHADMLLHYLPQLWQISEAHNLLRGAVVNVLHHLVKGLGVESGKIAHLTNPVIHYSTNVEQPAHIYLLEDGLELWQAVTQNVVAMTTDLLALFGNIFALLERASETLDACLAITRSYLIIDANAFLQEYSGKLSESFHHLLENIKEGAASKLADILKLIVQLAPMAFVERFQTNALDVFNCSIKDENYPPLMTKYLSIMAHLLIRQTESFFKLGHVYAELHNTPYDDVMSRLFDVWLEKIDCMQIREKKLSAISLVSLLPLKISFIGARFALILDVCVNVIYDLQKTESIQPDGQPSEDSLVVDWSTESFDENEKNNEEIRERKLLAQDPIYTVNLLQLIKEKMNQAKSSYGEDLFNEAMSTMDPAVAKQLLSLLN